MIHFTVSDVMPVLAVADVSDVNTPNISFNYMKNNFENNLKKQDFSSCFLIYPNI